MNICKKEDLRYCIFLLFLPIFIWMPLILQGRTFLGFDFVRIWLSAAHYIYQMGQVGKFFAWNPYLFSGLPTVAANVGDLFYPLNIFFLFFDPVKYSFYFFLLHLVISGFTGYAYLRHHSFKPFSAFIGAFLFSFSATRIYHATYLFYYGVLAFSPLVLLLIDLYIEKREVKYIGLLALVISSLILEAGINLLLIYIPIFILYGFFQAYRKIGVKNVIIPALGLAILVLGLSAILLLPYGLELAKAHPTRGIPFPYIHAVAGSVNLSTLLLVPFPLFYGDCLLHQKIAKFVGVWEHTYILGFAGVVLLFASLIYTPPKRKPLFKFFLTITFVGLIIALGDNTPVYPFLYKHVKFFFLFRRPARFLTFIPLVTLYICPTGVESLKIMMEKQGKRWKLFKILCGTFFVLYAFLFFVKGVHTKISVLLFVISLALVGGIIFSPKKGVIFSLILLSLVTAVSPIFYVESFFFEKGNFFKKEVAFLEDVKRHIPPYGKIFYPTNPTSCSMVGLSNICGTSPINLISYNEYLYAAFNGKIMSYSDFQKMLTLSFHPLVMLTEGEASFFENQKNIAKVNWDAIYRKKLLKNPMYKMLSPYATVLPNRYYWEAKPYPRLWISKRYKVMKNKEKVLADLMRKDFDPEDYVILPQKPEVHKTLLQKVKGSYAEITHFEPDLIKIRLHKVQGWLTLSDIYYHGWTAKIDGKPCKIYRGNYIFRTVYVKPENKWLTFKYEAPYLKIGLIITSISFLTTLCITLGFIPICRKKPF